MSQKEKPEKGDNVEMNYGDESASKGVTAAAKSIEPKGSKAKGSKAEVMKVAMNMISGMTPEELNGFQAMMGQFGPNADLGVPDGAAAKNAASINAKPSFAGAMKEDIEAMFNGEELTEEFKEKATTLFEAAVSAKVSVEVARLEEEYTNTLKEELTLFSEEVTDKLDTYLDYVVENWMTENEVAIESTLRNEISEQFIDDLKGLFEKNYMNVPEEKVDVIEELSSKVEQLESKLDQSIVENKELKNALVESTLEDIIDEVTNDLTVSQKEKFASFAEGVEFSGDFNEYSKKLEIIKENYFIKENSKYSSNITEEFYDGEETVSESVTYTDPLVNSYVRALERTVKK